MTRRHRHSKYRAVSNWLGIHKNDRVQRGKTSVQFTVGIQGRAVARGIRVYSKERLARANLGGVGEGIARRGSRTRWGRGRRCGGSEEDVGDAAEHADVEAGGPHNAVVRDVGLQYGADGVRAGREGGWRVP